MTFTPEVTSALQTLGSFPLTLTSGSPFHQGLSLILGPALFPARLLYIESEAWGQEGLSSILDDPWTLHTADVVKAMTSERSVDL